jgi:hypothetical protein
MRSFPGAYLPGSSQDSSTGQVRQVFWALAGVFALMLPGRLSGFYLVSPHSIGLCPVLSRGDPRPVRLAAPVALAFDKPLRLCHKSCIIG